MQEHGAASSCRMMKFRNSCALFGYNYSRDDDGDNSVKGAAQFMERQLLAIMLVL